MSPPARYNDGRVNFHVHRTDRDEPGDEPSVKGRERSLLTEFMASAIAPKRGERVAIRREQPPSRLYGYAKFLSSVRS